MDLKKIKEILDKWIKNPAIPKEGIEWEIITIIAEDENVIPSILQILNKERASNKDLINELNMELGLAHSFIKDKKMIERITDFYKKSKGKIKHYLWCSPWGRENLKDIYPEEEKKDDN